jgi:hypothetical protein
LRYKRSRFAGVLIAAALGLSTASAGQIFFTGNGTGDVVYSAWNIPTGIFGFFYDYFDVNAACTGGYCVAASTPGGTPLGNFGLTIAPNYYLSNVGNGELVTLVDTSVYYEQLVAYPSGNGTISMFNESLAGPNLLQGNITSIGIYATTGTTSAAFQFDITNATSQVISGLPSTVYLDIYGTAATDIATSTYNGSDTVFNPFDLDWTATLTDTSALSLNGAVSPSTSTAPEPSTLFLGLGGAVCFAARRFVRTRNLRHQ